MTDCVACGSRYWEDEENCPECNWSHFIFLSRGWHELNKPMEFDNADKMGALW